MLYFEKIVIFAGFVPPTPPNNAELKSSDSGSSETDPFVPIFGIAMQLAIITAKNGENAILRPIIGFETKQDYVIFSSIFVYNCISTNTCYI